MKKLVSILAIFLFTTLGYSQNTFWIVKGGIGDEAASNRSSQLDTTTGGNLLWLYNTTSPPTGGNNIAMEVWPKGSTAPSTELLLVSPYSLLMHNLQVYKDEIYLSTAMINPAVSNNSRPGVARLDTNGGFISSFMANGSNMGHYGNAYHCVFLEDTAFVVGQARSSNREDYYWAKINLATNTALGVNRWRGYGTERIRHATASSTGDSIFAVAYSYSHPSNIRPMLIHFDKQGNRIQQYRYQVNGSSFFHIERTVQDSLLGMGHMAGTNMMMIRMGMDGQVGRSLQYSSTNGATMRGHGVKVYGKQLLVYGYLQNETMGNGGEEGFLMALDSLGNVSWAKIYGGSGHEQITDLQIVEDGFYMTGKTNSSSQGGWDVMLLKTDFNGDVGQVSPCYTIIPYTAFITTANVSFPRALAASSSGGSLSMYSGTAITNLPSTDIFDDNCNVLGWQSETNIDQSIIEEAAFKVFPNPFGERLHIELTGPADQLDLTLLDQFGRVVHQENLRPAGETKYEWSLPTLAAGVYVLQVHAYHEGEMQSYQKSLLHR